MCLCWQYSGDRREETENDTQGRIQTQKNISQFNSRVYKYSIEVVATKFDMAENSAKTIIIY